MRKKIFIKATLTAMALVLSVQCAISESDNTPLKVKEYRAEISKIAKQALARSKKCPDNTCKRNVEKDAQQEFINTQEKLSIPSYESTQINLIKPSDQNDCTPGGTSSNIIWYGWCGDPNIKINAYTCTWGLSKPLYCSQADAICHCPNFY